MTICGAANPILLSAALASDITALGQWSPSNIFQPGISPDGVYQYTVNSAFCGRDSALFSIKTSPSVSLSIVAEVCPGTSYTYQNTPLAAGSSLTFSLSNTVTGCDSLVTV